MFKTDLHMTKVKNKIVQQQVRMRNFEEKVHRAENKRFEKAIKTFKMREKHREKKSNMERIKKFKEASTGAQGNLDIDAYLKQEGKKKRSTMELMRQERKKKLDQQKKRPGKSKRRRRNNSSRR